MKTKLREAPYFVQRALDFANSTGHASSFADFVDMTLMNKLGIRYEMAGDKASTEERLKRERRMTRAILRQVVDDPVLSHGLEKKINNWLKDERLCQLQFEDRELVSRFETRWDLKGVIQEAKLGIALLFATDRAKFLRECEACENLFLAEGKRNRAKYCMPLCDEAIELKNKHRNKRQSEFRHRRKWLKENDPAAYAAVAAGKIDLKTAYDKSRRRRK